MIRHLMGACCVLLLVSVAGLGASDVADAARDGDIEAVRALLGQQADPNVPRLDGSTALHWAVNADDQAMAEMLIPRRRERRNFEPQRRHADDACFHQGERRDARNADGRRRGPGRRDPPERRDASHDGGPYGQPGCGCGCCWTAVRR